MLLVAVSVANAGYLLTRRRKYHLMLRQVRSGHSSGPPILIPCPQDPLSSPNARSSPLDFSPPRLNRKPSWLETGSKFLWGLIWSSNANEEEKPVYMVQELNVWTPEYVKWSLRVFS